MSQKAQLIDPREHGHEPLSLAKPVFDADAIARAEEALKSLSGSFKGWLAEAVEATQAARLAAEAAGWSPEAVSALGVAAHNLKGLGATYECPIATQICASLCCLIESEGAQEEIKRDPNLARAHVDALRAMLRADVMTDAHPVGRALLTELETQVARVSSAAR